MKFYSDRNPKKTSGRRSTRKKSFPRVRETGMKFEGARRNALASTGNSAIDWAGKDRIALSRTEA